MLAPLDLQDYITKNVEWFNSTYTTAVTDWGWPRAAELVIHIEVLEEDRISTPPRICRLGSRAEYRARCRYIWKDRNLYRALRDIDHSHYVALASHADGRSSSILTDQDRRYCSPLQTPGPEYVIPADFCCIILGGWETEYWL